METYRRVATSAKHAWVNENGISLKRIFWHVGTITRIDSVAIINDGVNVLAPKRFDAGPYLLEHVSDRGKAINYKMVKKP